jgi:hypothetical protein
LKYKSTPPLAEEPCLIAFVLYLIKYQLSAAFGTSLLQASLRPLQILARQVSAVSLAGAARAYYADYNPSYNSP